MLKPRGVQKARRRDRRYRQQKENRAAVSRFSPIKSRPRSLSLNGSHPASAKAPAKANNNCIKHAHRPHLFPLAADDFGKSKKQPNDDQHCCDDPEILCVRPLNEILEEQANTPIGIEPMMISQPSHASLESQIGRTPFVPEWRTGLLRVSTPRDRG